MKTRGILTFALVLVAGCSGDFCDEFPASGACLGGGGSGGEPIGAGPSTGGEGGGPNGGGGEGGMGGMIDPNCDPRQTAEPIGAECGVFVNGAAAGAESGTQAEPYHSIGAALAASEAGARVYVCNSPLDEAVELSFQASLFGSLDCDAWSLARDRTPWIAPTNTIPLRIGASGNGGLVYGFNITSRDAEDFDDTTLQGNSSIAVFVDTAEVAFEEVGMTAGVGAPGGAGADEAGQAQGRQSPSGPADFDGNAPTAACNAAGGAAKAFMCGTELTRGGKGGDGDLTEGFQGGAGIPDHAAGEPNGNGGAGEPAGTTTWSCGTNGGIGDNGHDGPVGDPGGAGAALGTLTAGSLYAGDPGGVGGTGLPGQGGGGGGGRDGNNQNGCGAGATGPSGGGGGAGGCGGVGAGGGGAGGASIALVSLNAMVSFTNVTLAASLGGIGGRGGDGQLGGLGGNGANSAGLACRGGDGGVGGRGGGGGGGRGGPSLGIAFVGIEPDIDEGDVTVPGAGAAGGDGGNSNTQSNAGTAGLSAAKQAF